MKKLILTVCATVALSLALAIPAMAENVHGFALYDSANNYVESFESIEQLQSYVQDHYDIRKMPRYEAGCGNDPTKPHGSATYETKLQDVYDPDTNVTTRFMEVHCQWCGEVLYLYSFSI